MLSRVSVFLAAFLILGGSPASAATEQIESASDEPPVVRAISTGTWGFWGSAGYMRQYSESKNTWNVGLGLRTPSGKLESVFDGGGFSGSGLGTIVMENSFNTFARGYRYSTFFYRARGVYIHRLRHIAVPRVIKMGFPFIMRFGAGFGIYEIKYTVDEVIRDVPMQNIHSTYRRTEHFQRVEPMLEFGGCPEHS